MKTRTIIIAVQAFLSLAVFFTFVYSIEQAGNSFLRLFNLLLIIFFTNKVAKENAAEIYSAGYLSNIISLFRFNALIVLLVTISLAVFINYIDPTFAAAHGNNFLASISIASNGELLAAVAIEGLSASVVVSLGTLQFWKETGGSKLKSAQEYFRAEEL